MRKIFLTICAILTCFSIVVSQNVKTDLEYNNAYSFGPNNTVTVSFYNPENPLEVTFGLTRIPTNGTTERVVETIPIGESFVGCGTYPDFIWNTHNFFLIVDKVDDDKMYYVVKVAETGALDVTFGNKGMVSLADVTTEVGSLSEITIDAQNRILVGGKSVSEKPLIIRLLSNGALDTSFNTKGFVELATKTPGVAYVNAISVDTQIAATLEVQKKMDNGGLQIVNELVLLNNHGVVATTCNDAIAKLLTNNFAQAYTYGNQIYLLQNSQCTIADLQGKSIATITMPDSLSVDVVLYNEATKKAYIVAKKGSAYATNHETHLFTINANGSLTEILDSKNIVDGVLFLDYTFLANNSLRIVATQVHPYKSYEYIPFVYTVKLPE